MQGTDFRNMREGQLAKMIDSKPLVPITAEDWDRVRQADNARAELAKRAARFKDDARFDDNSDEDFALNRRAKKATKAAKAASDMANGPDGTREDHEHAHHLHERAARANIEAGDGPQARYHRRQMEKHQDAIQEQRDAMHEKLVRSALRKTLGPARSPASGNLGNNQMAGFLQSLPSLGLRSAQPTE